VIRICRLVVIIDMATGTDGGGAAVTIGMTA